MIYTQSKVVGIKWKKTQGKAEDDIFNVPIIFCSPKRDLYVLIYAHNLIKKNNWKVTELKCDNPNRRLYVSLHQS